MQKYKKIDRPEILKCLFNNPKGDPASALSPGENGEEVQLAVSADVQLPCRYYPATEDSPVLLFFPSTLSSAASLAEQAGNYNAHEIGVFLVGYRGRDDIDGLPAVGDMIVEASKLAPVASEWLKRRGVTGPLFVFGQSLGSVCAIECAVNSAESIKGLIIESGIGKTSSFLEALSVPADLSAIPEEEGFDTIGKIGKIKLPTLIFHGSRDVLVPVAQAEVLQASSGAKSKQFFVIPGADHHSLPKVGGKLYFQTIKKHLDTVCGKNTWRERRKKMKNIGEGE
ncbi:MAG: alpha/beta hydrolase [Desulforhopalus sp.]